MAGRRHQEERIDLPTTRPKPLVAVHADVADALREWQRSKHRPVAIKAANLIQALVRDEQDVVSAVLRQLAVDSIREAPGLVELGPKQSRGGAARLFLYREHSNAFFVFAAIEKGSSGVRIDRARERAKEIRGVFARHQPADAVRLLSEPEGAYRFLS